MIFLLERIWDLLFIFVWDCLVYSFYDRYNLLGFGLLVDLGYFFLGRQVSLTDLLNFWREN